MNIEIPTRPLDKVLPNNQFGSASDREGVTYREEFAARIFSAMHSFGVHTQSSESVQKRARQAVFHADVLISALNMDPSEIHNEFNPQTKDQ